jgi:hypothetical protein
MTDCISCNSCLYSIAGSGRVSAYAECLFKTNKEEYRIAQRWLKKWAEEATKSGE